MVAPRRSNVGNASLVRIIFLLLFVGAAVSIASPAQTLKTVLNFTNASGYDSTATLVQGANGSLYGTAADGGANHYGTIFSVTPAGKLSVLYSFCAQTNCTDGESPVGLIQTKNGNLYGTTSVGGPEGGGTVFEIAPSGKLTTVYGFGSNTNPNAGVIQAADGDFYGTTVSGGLYGTIFKVTPAGVLTTLYTFCAQTNCADGRSPTAALVQATNGDFYSTTIGGGAYGYGTVFKMTPQGVLTTLHSFDSSDGAEPESGVIQGSNGHFYGTTYDGGANLFGTVFEITAAGKFTTLYSFCSQPSCADGGIPEAGLAQATDGNFYGTTEIGGANINCSSGQGCGTIFEIANGKLTTLYSFCSQTNCSDGETPLSGALLQATNGSFYGTTRYSGADATGAGTLFSLSVGLGPFVETRPTSGKVGAKVTIVGNKLTGATSVSFNGTAATFKVVSSTEITTTVPTGAVGGAVEVTTPDGTLKSNVAFRVHP
jgi:uncharacterized repeat protein (TIGR03803 family)